MWDSVPKRWNNMATNWIIRIRPKKKTKTRPIGSSCKYSLVIKTYIIKKKKIVKIVYSSLGILITYLRSFFNVGNVRLDTQRPIDVQSTFVQLQQEHDQDEKSVEHEEEEHRFVS